MIEWPLLEVVVVVEVLEELPLVTLFKVGYVTVEVAKEGGNEEDAEDEVVVVVVVAEDKDAELESVPTFDPPEDDCPSPLVCSSLSPSKAESPFTLSAFR